MSNIWNRIFLITKEFFSYIPKFDGFRLQYADTLETMYYKGSDISSTTRYISYFPRMKVLMVVVDQVIADFDTVDQFFDQVEPTTKDVLFDFRWEADEGSFNDNASAMNKKKVVSTIDILRTNIPMVNDGVISYILQKFNRLSSLALSDMEKRDCHSRHFGFNLSTTVLDQIIDNAIKLQKLEVSRMYLNNQHEILDILIRKRNLVGDFVLDYEGNSLTNNDPHMLISIKKNKGMRADNLQIVATVSQNRDTVRYENFIDYLQPYIDLLVQYDKHLHTLTLHDLTHGTRHNFDHRIESDQAIHLIDNVLKHCPSMKSLTITKGSFKVDERYMDSEPLDSFRNSSVETQFG